jgi:hypothetical protein
MAVARDVDLTGVDRVELDGIDPQEAFDRGDAGRTERDLHDAQRLDQRAAGDQRLVREQQPVKALAFRLVVDDRHQRRGVDDQPQRRGCPCLS